MQTYHKAGVRHRLEYVLLISAQSDSQVLYRPFFQLTRLLVLTTFVLLHSLSMTEFKFNSDRLAIFLVDMKECTGTFRLEVYSIVATCFKLKLGSRVGESDGGAPTLLCTS